MSHEGVFQAPFLCCSLEYQCFRFSKLIWDDILILPSTLTDGRVLDMLLGHLNLFDKGMQSAYERGFLWVL